jgi:hypothetical protein
VKFRGVGEGKGEEVIKPHLTQYIDSRMDEKSTYDNRLERTGHPVSSAM